jgi:peptidoglycan/LPS O-acetylase OafA/YrhL
LALFGFARRHLNRPAAPLAYLAESAFPVYLLHQTAIVVVGYGIIQLRLGIAAKFGLLLAASVMLTLAVYHFVVRRFAVTRFLFGMKARPAAIADLPPLGLGERRRRSDPPPAPSLGPT